MRKVIVSTLMTLDGKYDPALRWTIPFDHEDSNSAVFGAGDPAAGIILPFEVWRELACNDIDLATATELYAEMNPIPAAYLMDPLDLKTFYELVGTGKLRASYVNAINDIAMPPGEYAWFPRYAKRLGPLCRILQVNGGHEAKYTRPDELSEALVQAGRD